jgi:hypothetical protein
MLTRFSISSNEYAQLEGKKTIQPADVIAALKENEFEHFIPRLEAELKSNIPPPPSLPKHSKTNVVLQNTTQSNATNETPTAARSAKKKRQKPAKTVNPQTAEQKTEILMQMPRCWIRLRYLL